MNYIFSGVLFLIIIAIIWIAYNIKQKKKQLSLITTQSSEEVIETERLDVKEEVEQAPIQEPTQINHSPKEISEINRKSLLEQTNDKLLRNDPCFCGSEKKYKKCHSDIHPSSKAAKVIRHYKEIDIKTAEYQRLTENKPPCHKGCINCCYDDFSITEVEFELIIREMKSWSEQDVIDTFNIALEQCEHMKSYAPHVWKNLELHNQEDISIIQRQTFYQKLRKRNQFPCPMLNKAEGACTVYESRPSICRLFGSTHITSQISQPKELCEFILDSSKLVNSTPNMEKEWSSLTSFINTLKAPNGLKVPQRTYPIYYWFYIIYNRTGEKKAHYNHYDSAINFDRPIEQADYQTLKGYGLLNR